MLQKGQMAWVPPYKYCWCRDEEGSLDREEGAAEGSSSKVAAAWWNDRKSGMKRIAAQCCAVSKVTACPHGLKQYRLLGLGGARVVKLILSLPFVALKVCSLRSWQGLCQMEGSKEKARGT